MNGRETITAVGAVVTLVGYLVTSVVQEWDRAFATAGLLAGLLVGMLLFAVPRGEDGWPF